jgi:hypothetical protein
MALHEITLADETVDVSINSKLGLVAVLHRKAVAVYEYSGKKRTVRNPKLIRSIPIPIEDESTVPLQVVLCDDGTISVLVHRDGREMKEIFSGHVNAERIGDDDAEEFLEDFEVSRISTTLETGQIYLESNSGSVKTLDRIERLQQKSEGSRTFDKISIQLPGFCAWTEVVEKNDNVSELFSPTAFLTCSRQLHLD